MSPGQADYTCVTQMGCKSERSVCTPVARLQPLRNQPCSSRGSNPMGSKKVRVHTRPYLRQRDRLMEKPYHCQYCGLAFKQPCYLRCHERIHTGEKPYKCRFCPKTFRLSNFLRQHEMTHTGEKPYSCDYCSKRFRQKPHLKDHERIHMRWRENTNLLFCSSEQKKPYL